MSVVGDRPTQRVGRSFVALYTLAMMGTSLVFIAPLLVTLPLKVASLVGIEKAPAGLALVAGVGALLAMVGNPVCGALSDRTTSRWGRRRPWMVLGWAGGAVGTLVVAVAPTVPVVLAGWCLAQLSFNALLAALVAVLPDRVPAVQRGVVAGVLGVCVPVASVSGTFVVQLFTGDQLAMFLAPCVIGGIPVLLFAATLRDRAPAAPARPSRSLRDIVGTFSAGPDFAWVFASRFLFVLAYAFLTTYQAYYLLDGIHSAAADVPRQIFLATLVQAAAVVAASLLGGALSDRTGRRKVFVAAAALVYGVALFVIAGAGGLGGFLVGMAVGGLGFGVYVAVDLALVADVLPDERTVARDLGVFNIAGALPYSIAPAIAPLVLAAGGGSYGVLYAVAGACAVAGAVAVLPVERVR